MISLSSLISPRPHFLSLEAPILEEDRISHLASTILASLGHRSPRTDTYPLPFPDSVFEDAYEVFISHSPMRKKLEDGMKLVTDKELAEFVKGVGKGRLIFDDIFKVLRALKEGYINIHQAGTLILFESAYLLHDGKWFELSEEIEKRAPVVCDFSSVSDLRIFEKAHELTHDFFKLNSRDKEFFYSLVSSLPCSERRFLMVPMIYPKEKSEMWHQLTERVRFCPFHIYENSFSSYQLIPSCGLMQAYLMARFGENAVRIKPVLGPYTEKEICQDWLERSHVLAIPHPLANKKMDLIIADNYKAYAYVFTWHDFYHCAIASGVPEIDCLLFIEMYHAGFSESLSPLEKENLFKFVDMEHNYYINAFNFSKQLFLNYPVDRHLHIVKYVNDLALWISFAKITTALSDETVKKILKFLLTKYNKETLLNLFSNHLNDKNFYFIIPRDEDKEIADELLRLDTICKSFL